MKYRVKITRLPQARTGYQVQGGLANDIATIGGGDFNSYNGKKQLQARQTMGAVPRDEANLEAEGGETLIGDLDGSTMPSFFGIKGPRHSAGGVPMSLPDDTFIFSDTKAMKINDPKILKMFGKSVKKGGGYTPAELSKVYDVNKYRKILQDPESNKMEIKTAEMMIKNYVMKLGALAIAQESKKNFPQGIPVISKPYMEANGITEEDLMPELAKQRKEEEAMQQQMMAQQQQQQVPEQGIPEQGMQQEVAPMQMPDGQPIAQPSMEQGMAEAQQMPAEQMQGAPMARFGMIMGGFDMPLILENGGSSFYDIQNPMDSRSSKLNMFTDNDLYTAKNGGNLNKFDGTGVSQVNADGTPKTKEQLQKELREGKVTVTKTKKLPDGTVEITRSDGTKVYAKGDSAGDIIYQKDPEMGKKGTGKVDPEQYKIDACNRIKKEGWTVEQAVMAGLIHVSQKANFKHCENLKKTGEDKSEFYELEQDCPCKDDKGVEIPGVFATKDDAGNCLPETCYEEVQKCYCINPETGQEVETKLTDGKCDCETEGLEQGSYQGQEQQGGYGFPEWTTQDKLNFGTALATQTGIEYPTAMTYQAPEVKLAKQDWLAGNQALTGQGAKNLDIIARSTAPSNVKQASAASLQGDIAEGVVNNIAGVQARNVGTENQEALTNYQGRTSAGQNRQNVLNQYMDKVGATENNYRGEMNAKRALTTQMANTGIKNAADIYNLQTEQYRIDPRTGMQIFKGGKPLKPEASEADDIAYIQGLQKAGIKDDQIELLLKKRLSKYGGAMFKHGGIVYGNSTYPFYND